MGGGEGGNTNELRAGIYCHASIYGVSERIFLMDMLALLLINIQVLDILAMCGEHRLY